MKIVIAVMLVLAFWVNAAAAGALASPMDASPSDASTGGNAHGTANSANLNEIIVTAQKFAQAAFDVPISLAVVSGPELQQSYVRNLDDLSSIVPGLTVVDNGPDSYVNIRGISNIFGGAALVGTYLDEADVTTVSGLPINLYTYDLQRVEVLRGPQGTLYGEGSIGGTIRYVTNKPVLDRVQMSADGTATFDQYGAPGQQITAVVNAPVVSDRLAIRVAADFDHEGGWIDAPAASQKNINGQDISDARIEAAWRLAPEFSVNATQIIHRAAEGTFVGEDANGNYNQVFGQTTTPAIDDNYNVSNLTLDWHGGYLQVLDSATWIDHTLSQRNTGYTFEYSPPPSPPFDEYIAASRAKDKDWSDELRFASNDGGALHWVVGGFYRHFTSDATTISYYFALPGPAGSPLPTAYGPASVDTVSKSRAVFGDASYQLFGALTVGAGVRYFKDDEEYSYLFLPGQAAVAAQAGSFRSTDPRFYIDYGISREVKIYASAAKGFRSGGFNSLGFPSYGPESVWTYEVGAKTRNANYGISADADVFRSDYGQYQIVGIAPPPAIPQDITRNAGAARIKGIEGSVRWIPANGWQLGVDGDYIDARLVTINLTQSSSSYYVGDPLDFVPRYQVTASGEKDFSLDGRTAFSRVEYSQTAPMTFRNRSIGTWYYSQSDRIDLLNFRLGIQWSRELQLAVFVRNVLNDRGYTGPDVIESAAPRERPRTFGLEFSASMK